MTSRISFEKQASKFIFQLLNHIYSQSCEYSTWPRSTTTMTNGLGAPTTNMRLCHVCTPHAINEGSCQTIPGCIPQVAVASVTVGSKPVHVGTLTGGDLYTSVLDALVSLCPIPSQTVSATQFDETGSLSIGGIEYVDDEFLQTVSLVVEVPTSGYNHSQSSLTPITTIPSGGQRLILGRQTTSMPKSHFTRLIVMVFCVLS